ncbi:hypothetical protein NKG05_22525 [Oerskovia sp. M15]
MITEWTASDPAAETFEGTSREMMRVPFGGRVHTVQQIAFNPTAEPADADYGMLYVLAGDGATASATATLRTCRPPGKILRIDPMGDDSANGQYGIPADNPFVGTREPWARPTPSACATRTASAGTPRATTRCTSGTSVSGRSSPSTRSSPGTTSAGPCARVRSSPRTGRSTRCRRRRRGVRLHLPGRGLRPQPRPRADRRRGRGAQRWLRLPGRYPRAAGRYLFTDLVRGWVLATEADEMVRNDGDLEDLAEIEHLRVFHEGVETTFQELVGDQRVDLRFGSDADGELYLVSKADGKIWKVVGARNAGASSPVALPELAPHLVAHYDFDHPAEGAPTWEADQGGRARTSSSSTAGSRCGSRTVRTRARARRCRPSRWTRAQHRTTTGRPGSTTRRRRLSRAFADAEEISVMGWFKPTGEHPALNSGTADPDDRYNAIGLAGVLTGTSDGHAVRALLEVITVDGELRLVALGRRVDGAGSWTFAADLPWDQILERNTWVHLAATFDFAGGEMRLFMNGEELEGRYTSTTNPGDRGPRPRRTRRG